MNGYFCVVIYYVFTLLSIWCATWSTIGKRWNHLRIYAPLVLWQFSHTCVVVLCFWKMQGMNSAVWRWQSSWLQFEPWYLQNVTFKLYFYNVFILYSILFSNRSTCAFKWCLLENEILQISHLNGLSFLWTASTWIFISCDEWNDRLHWVHSNGLNFLCTASICWAKWCLRLKNLSGQSSHLNGLKFSCTDFICTLKFYFDAKFCSQFS